MLDDIFVRLNATNEDIIKRAANRTDRNIYFYMTDDKISIEDLIGLISDLVDKIDEK